MFIVRLEDNRVWGPFKTADAAAKWAEKTMPTSLQWSILQLRSTK